VSKETFGLAEITFMKRVIIGNNDPANLKSEEYLEGQRNLLNLCLKQKGRIIGQEKNFAIVNMGEHQIVLQWIVYHIGFKRKPAGLE
jgi:hypothetical protein